MLLPSSESAVLLILALSLLAWGSWTSLFRAARKWRFELFYYDFALGFLIAAVIAAFTLGSWDSKELTFQDNLLLASRRQLVWVAGAGLLLGLGNLFLLAGATVGGTAVGFSLTFGSLLAIDTVWELMVNPLMNGVLAGGGIGLAVVSTIVAVIAYAWLRNSENLETAQALRADPRFKPPVQAGVAKGPVMSIFAGVLLAVFLRVLGAGIAGDAGAAPYTAVLILGMGVAASSVFFVPFFLYFPLRGGALQVRHYFKGNKSHHLLGLLGGVLGAAAILALVVAGSAPGVMKTRPVEVAYLTFGTPVIAAIWGLLVWREFAAASFRTTFIFLISVILMLASIGMIGVSTL
jgi:glucose uptake protein